jgi:ABC-2 type transport system permease protein
VNGVLTMARLEFTVRVRAGRWRWLLGGWFGVLVLFTVLLRLAIGHDHGLDGSRGTVMYGGLQLFQLALALLVVPALTSQSVNGDSERGTLAVLQVTNLSAFDIAAGKLLAAWATACVFLVTSAPIVVWAMVEGGVSVIRVVVVTVVVALLLAVICSISLGLSAVLARSTTSSVLSYLAVFALTVGTVVLFGLSTALTARNDFGVRTRSTWWILAPNPFVILADATPTAPQSLPTCHVVPQGFSESTSSAPTSSGVEICTGTDSSTVDPLGAIGRVVRELRAGPGPGPGSSSAVFEPAAPGVIVPSAPATNGGLVWPYGLGFDLALGAGMLAVTTRRLRTPRHGLARGVRLG